ncbi:MAG: hypothetical protein COB29_01290 [Sulfitobacter sp.]|nr:MAG: hypothetical protein COB29_01290 [Sulfitobacter sp.]
MFSRRGKYVGVRIIPDLASGAETEEKYQQHMNMYVPHVWLDSDDNTQNWLKGTYSSWSAAWEGFLAQEHHKLPVLWQDVEFGLDGALQVHYSLHLYLPCF